MRAFALTCEALSHLDSIEGKVHCAAAHLSGRPSDEVEVAARFLSGSPLPPGTRAPRVGRATIAKLVAERCGIGPDQLRRRAVSKGDLGTAVALALEALGEAARPGLALKEAAEALEHLGNDAAAGRTRRLRGLFERVGPLEAKYLTKLLLGSLRTGMQAGRVEEVIALAYQQPVEAVRRAHMLIGDIGLVATRARQGKLENVGLRCFRPVRSMLAHAAESAAEILDHLQPPMVVEDKLDGIRAQFHVEGRRHRIYSRSLEDLTHLFPELGDGLDGVSDGTILDGEIIAWKDGPLAFAELQQRLGRRQVPLTMLLDVPVVFLAFDVLCAGGRDLIDEPLSERKSHLERLDVEGIVRAAAHTTLTAQEQVEKAFEAALEAGHEGVVFKDPASPYRPGTRGRAWLKLKQPLGTLDVVVTAAQYGHGKRAGWLSDLTFAVDGEDTLLDVGKAYSGLTDAEIVELTDHLKATTIERDRDVHRVQPTVILEVAFGGIQRSNRHASGFALRFPRIVRRRTDLSTDQIDSVERVARIFERQKTRPRDL